MESRQRGDVLVMPSQPLTAIASPPLTRPPPDPPPSSLNVTVPPPPANTFRKRAPPKPPWIFDRLESSRVSVSKSVNFVYCDVSLFSMFYLCCCVFVFNLKCVVVSLFSMFYLCCCFVCCCKCLYHAPFGGNLCFQDVNSKAALYMFVKMSQMRWMLSGKKDWAESHDVADTNLCNSSLFQFSSKHEINLDIIETTYSRTVLAAVANLIRNWIDIKTVDSLIFGVIDRVRKTLQVRLLVCRCWLNNINLAASQSLFSDDYHILLGFICNGFLLSCWRCVQTLYSLCSPCGICFD
jgi:hypothetical protein